MISNEWINKFKGCRDPSDDMREATVIEDCTLVRERTEICLVTCEQRGQRGQLDGGRFALFTIAIFVDRLFTSKPKRERSWWPR